MSENMTREEAHIVLAIVDLIARDFSDAEQDKIIEFVKADLQGTRFRNLEAKHLRDAINQEDGVF